MFKIACQSIIYKEVLKENPGFDFQKKILSHIVECGYEAVETGTAFFDEADINDYISYLKEINLKVAALHMGGDFITEEGQKYQLETIGKTISVAKALGTNLIYCSGTFKDNRPEEEFVAEATILDKIGSICKENGMVFCYHNHWWEFENDWQGFNILMEKTSPENVALVPDVGWLTVSGVKPVEFIEKYFDRIKALHFKDFVAFKEFCNIGTGIVDFKAVAEFYKSKNADNLWISAEQDVAEDCYAGNKINYDYIKSII